MLANWQKEARLLAATLSPRKLANAAALAASYRLSRARGIPQHWGMPMSLGAEPTTACNLRCPHCISGLRAFERPTGRMPLDRLQAAIDELQPWLVYLILYFQGEPYLNPDFLRMARYATDHNVFVMSSTNAHFLDAETAGQTVESGLQRLLVSIDGMTQDTYARYRVAGQLEQALAGLRRLGEAKQRLKRSTPFVEVQFIVFEHNRHEIEQVKQLAQWPGVDRVALKSAQVIDLSQAEAWVPKDPNLARYTRTASGQWTRKGGQAPNHCWKMWQGAEMTWDGQVLPCCFDKNAQYAMGRFPETSFADIWRGTAYQHFRAQLLQGRDAISMCRNCSEGLKVRFDAGG